MIKKIENTIINQRNLQLNEDFFDDYDYNESPSEAPKTQEETETLAIDTLLNDINIERYKSCKLNLIEYASKIKDWFRTYTNIANWYDSISSMRSPESMSPYSWSSYLPSVVLNSNGTVDVYGPLIVANISEWPEYLYIDKVHTVTRNDGTLIAIGHFSLRNCLFYNIPKGCPEVVDGSYTIAKCSYIKNLRNVGKEIHGGLTIQMCDNLNDLSNDIKRLDGPVLSDADITKNEILRASIYSKTANKIIDEAIVYRNNHVLNEAFESNILRKLFSKKENKDVAKALKNIPVLWSDLPDYIIFPCYGGLEKTKKLRAEKDVTKYGLTIFCDKNDVIKFIVSGDGRSKYTTADGEEHSWRDDTWLYISPDAESTINERIDKIKELKRGMLDSSTEAAINDYFDNLGINPRALDEYKSKIYSSNDINFGYLSYVPDFCVKNYVLKAASNIEDENDTRYSNFSYLSQQEIRNDIKTDRLQTIRGMYLSTVNANEKSPLYSKHINLIITDDIYKNMMNERLDQASAISLLKKLRKSIQKTAAQVRSEIIALYDKVSYDENDDKNFTDVTLDKIYSSFIQCDYQRVLKYIKDGIESIEKDQEKRKNKENLTYRGYTKDVYKSDPFKKEARNTFKGESSYDDFQRSIRDYFGCSRKLANLLCAIEEYKDGNFKAIKDYLNK